MRSLHSALTGTAGTCPPIDGDENAGLCHFVRCQGSKRAFVIRDPALQNFGVESVRLSTGNFHQTFVLDLMTRGEGGVALAVAPALLQALKSAARAGMDLRTEKAAQSYVPV